MLQEGTVAVGDISNSTDTFKTKQQSPIRYYSFIEFFGLGESLADELYSKSLKNYDLAKTMGLAAGLTPHAPYTMSGRAFELLKIWHNNHPQEA